MYAKNFLKILFVLVLGSVLMGCQTVSTSPAENGRLSVAATTSIVADVVQQIGGDSINIHQVIPNGTDPHSFSPTPRDLSQISGVKVVFVNGAGLEETLLKVLKNTVPDATLIEVSQNNPLIEGHEHQHGDEAGMGETHTTEGEEGHPLDPHTWTDPNNVMQWVDIIVTELSRLDPAHQQMYQKNGEAYKEQLKEADRWIQEQVAQIPAENRKLVTDHLAWGYFAKRYGFEQIGAIIPGFSTLAEPSAQEIAALEEQIRSQNIRAIFVGNQSNPALAKRIAEDTGAKVVPLYVGTLSDSDGPAATYLAYLRYNVNAIVDALK